MFQALGLQEASAAFAGVIAGRITDEGRSFMADTHTKIRRHPDFAKRLLQACDGNPHVPQPNFGRLRWFSDQLQERFGIDSTVEGVRKWFDGLTLPRPATMDALSQILEIDRAWLAMGVTANLDQREQKLRNAEADGAVNVVAGMIQMSGSNPAFPTTGDARAAKSHIDLYAIIRGAQYAFHVTVASEVDGGFRFAVPVEAAQDAVILAVIRREGFAVDLLELDAEGLAEHGKRKGPTVEIVMNPNYRTENHTWRQIKSFSERL